MWPPDQQWALGNKNLRPETQVTRITSITRQTQRQRSKFNE